MTTHGGSGRQATLPVELGPETFDREYAVIDHATRLWGLAAEAFGEEYPTEVQPWGATTWWVLGRLVASARLQPGQLLVDAGCGRGGPGLWLARATGAALVGVDWSRVAVDQATARAGHFVSSGTARFQVGDLADTGLGTSTADVVVCLDALPYALDRVAALREAHRLLRPGGRYLATIPQASEGPHPRQVADWSSLCSAAGLRVESIEQVPGYSEHLAAMFAVWSANQDMLRDELGEQVARQLLERTDQAGVALAGQQQVLICARAG